MYAPEIKQAPNEKCAVEAKEQYRADIEFRAWALIQTKESHEARPVFYPERADNARTALMEALTASGHLSRVEIAGDSPEDIHSQVVGRLLNGYNESLPAHERERRFFELCEELHIHDVHQSIVRGEKAASTAVAVISDYPSALPDREAQNLGYRPENKKGMVRSTHLERQPDGTYLRVIEQISRSGSGPDTTFALLSNFDERVAPHEKSDIAALRRSFEYDTGHIIDGVVDLQRRLDAFAGKGVRYGEYENELHVAYESLRNESAEREKQLEQFVGQLAQYEEKLDGRLKLGEIDSNEHAELYRKEVQQILRTICILAPEYAEDCFGESAALHYRKASDFEIIGDYASRDASLSDAVKNEQPVTFCGVMISSEEGVDSSDLSNRIMEAKKLWTYKKGYCRVASCSTRKPEPKKVEIGPCSVCRQCEKKFDTGVLK